MNSQPGSDHAAAPDGGLGFEMDPDLRAERVEAIRRALAAGTYRVAAEDVANAIVEFYARPSVSPEPD